MNEDKMVRKKVMVTIDPELIEWVDKLVEEKKFRNRSHSFEYALHRLKKGRCEESPG